jgi:(p)ppGpp synthase/HD superfamily hydrolase
MLGEKFDEALKLASELHREQTRKGTPIPYLAHLMAVAGIVLEANAYHQFHDIEDIAIGALLHDAIEDQGHKIKLEEIRERFGQTVHDIVRDCSDAIIEEEDQEKAPWRERKEAYISKVRNKPPATILVSCADKLHNARSIMFDYDKIGDEVWDRFKPTKEETLWYYESLCEAFRQAWPENPLLPDFKAVVARMRRAVMNDLKIVPL